MVHYEYALTLLRIEGEKISDESLQSVINHLKTAMRHAPLVIKVGTNEFHNSHLLVLSHISRRLFSTKELRRMFSHIRNGTNSIPLTSQNGPKS